jgi:hypothetical protein
VNDTHPDVRALQDAIVRRMSPEQRLLSAFELSEAARELLRARLRSEHPDWTPRDVAREMLRLALHPEPLPEALR